MMTTVTGAMTVPLSVARWNRRAPRRSAEVSARWGLGLLCTALAVVSGNVWRLLPWLVLVVVLDSCVSPLLASTRPVLRRRASPPLLFLTMTAVAAAAGLSVGPSALPLLLVPAFHAGIRLGTLGVAAVVGAEVAVAVGVGIRGGAPADGSLVTVVQGVALALVLGLVGSWATSIRRTSTRETLLAEAGGLLRRLHLVAEGLDTGFDAPASAERALDDLALSVDLERAAVLVTHNGEHCTPLALRGTQRVPWPDPAVPGTLLHRAWSESVSVVTTWVDAGIPRSVLAVPLAGDRGARLGVLVLDRPAGAVAETEVAAAREVGGRLAPSLDVAILFERLRSRSALEERARLGRAMHDGIAQELAALGYQVDAIRARARREGGDFVPELDDLRSSLSTAMTDIRLRIADLRVGDHLDARLGAVISSRLQSFGTLTGISTTTRLTEAGFRLPAHLEVMIYRLVLDVLEDARRSEGTTRVSVELDVTAPEAEVRVVHDGVTSLHAGSFADHPLVGLGGRIDVLPTLGRGTSVRVHLPHLPRSERAPEGVRDRSDVVA